MPDPLNLIPSQVEELAQRIFTGQEPKVNGMLVDQPDSLDEQSRIAVQRRVQELKDAAEANQKQIDEQLNVDKKPSEEVDENDGKYLPGGVEAPAGYRHVATVTANHEAGEETWQMTDLFETTEIQQLEGVSVTMDKPAVSSKYGVLRARMIHDFGARAYIFRRDFPEENKTCFIVSLSHQAVAPQ